MTDPAAEYAALLDRATPFLRVPAGGGGEAGYGQVAVAGDEWLRAAAAPYLRGLPKLLKLRRYNPNQPRNPDGKWRGGDLDIGDFSPISTAEGTFGEVLMGVDSVGDVALSFHETHRGERHVRTMELDADEFVAMVDAVEELAEQRDDADASDLGGLDVFAKLIFGGQDEHAVELSGNGIISIVFGAEDDEPWVLSLDPPDPDEDDPDDVASFLEAAEDVKIEVGAA